ncbi:hypothetical protein EC9_25200 [Rosistilla ulvae]|uniref:Uncharacterized protein n=1 Tax=Rosistilla ulvae TaxID=1930277 RepID=A0A517M0C5_9BACT|nr:hypothetical protein EC9_25200 [Rosistilla ulvae]
MTRLYFHVASGRLQSSLRSYRLLFANANTVLSNMENGGAQPIAYFQLGVISSIFVVSG